MIYVIDDIMGSGKTSWILDYINRHRGTRFLCVVPTLSECKRYIKETDIGMVEPEALNTKYFNLLCLIERGENIVATHSLIKRIDVEFMYRIHEKGYVLIIDEALEVLTPYKISKSDTEMIYEQQLVSLDEDGFLVWQDKNYVGKFDDIKRLCESRALMTYINHKGKLVQPFMWNFPVDFFHCFEKAFILTYMWDGSIQRSYFQIHGIEYQKMMLDRDGEDMIPYDADLELEKRAQVVNYINICYYDSYNRIGKRVDRSMPLSKSWYQRELKKYKKRKALGNTSIHTIQNNTRNYFRNSKAKYNMFTCHKFMKEHLEGTRYKDKKSNTCFVPCNARGTNDFAHKNRLAYLLNFYLPADISKFVGHYRFSFDDNQYALSALLQWIWRSAIRTGEVIDIYIPSERMRGMLEDWINESSEYISKESIDDVEQEYYFDIDSGLYLPQRMSSQAI